MLSRKTSWVLSAAVAGALVPGFVHGATLAVYDTTGAGTASLVSSSGVPTGVNATSLTLGSNETARNMNTNAFGSRNTNTDKPNSAAAAFSAGDYFTFTLTPAANYSYTISGLSSAVFTSSTNPAIHIGWFYSTNGFSSNTQIIATDTIATTFPGNNLGAATINLSTTSAVEFRLAQWRDNSGANNQRDLAISNGNGGTLLTISGTTPTLRGSGTLTWDGNVTIGSGTTNWSAYNGNATNQSNWNNNNTPLSGDNLLFTGSTNLTNTNDLSGLSIGTMIFDTAAGAFTIGGNTLTVNNGVTNNKTGLTETVNLPITIGSSNATFTTATSGSTTFGGSITLGSNKLTVDGGGTTSISGRIEGSGGTLDKVGAGRLILTNANSSYTGATTVSGGTLQMGAVNALSQSSDLTVNASATVDLNNFNTTVQSVAGAGRIVLGTGQLTTGNSSDTTFSGIISGTNGKLVKVGSGSLTLSGPNTYTGLTDIQNGNLLLKSTGNIAGSIRVAAGKTFDVTDFGATGFSVANAATLSGSGTVSGKTKIGGTAKISPGDVGSAPAVLPTGDQEWAGGGTYVWDIKDANGTAGADYDQLQLSGALSVSASTGSKFNIDITSLTAGNANGNAANFVKTENYDWVIATTSSPVTLDPNAFAFVDHFTNDTTSNGTVGAVDGAFSISGSGNDVVLHYSAAPEPAGVTLLGLGILGWMGRRPGRRR